MYKLKEPKDYKDVEVILKAKQENEMGLANFATITGIKGMQFGRDIYSSVLAFEDLIKFLSVFPEVQRTVSMVKVRQIKRYVLSGVKEEDAMRFFSGITVTCRSHIFYDETNHKLAIDLYNSKLSINDGQHRFLGISAAIDELEKEYDRENDATLKQEIKVKLDELKSYVLPLVLFNQIGDREEKQLFHDTNNLASRPSRSTTIKLNQTDLYSRMAKEISENNRYMQHFGVESEKASIHSNNPNLILLTTIYRCCKEFLRPNQKQNKDFLTEETYPKYYKKVYDIFDNIFKSLPYDINHPSKYILEKHYSFKAIARFYSHIVQQGVSQEKVFEVVEKMNWENDLAVWAEYGAARGQNGHLMFAGSGDRGSVGVYEALLDKYAELKKAK